MILITSGFNLFTVYKEQNISCLIIMLHNISSKVWIQIRYSMPKTKFSVCTRVHNGGLTNATFSNKIYL